jgi:hypothetical protein
MSAVVTKLCFATKLPNLTVHRRRGWFLGPSENRGGIQIKAVKTRNILHADEHAHTFAANVTV